MNYLKNINNFIKYFKYQTVIFIPIILISFDLICSENKILFKINNQSITTLDFENRKSYIEFIGDNENLDDKIIMNDFVSANIFYQNYIVTKKTYELDDKINSIYLDIVDKKNLKNNNSINKKSILHNLKLDLIRKSILEEILNRKKNKIINTNNEIDLLYNFNITYLNLFLKDFKKIENKINNKAFKNIRDLEKYFKDNKINFYKKTQEISNINSINDKIKKNISSNKNFFKIVEENNIYFIEVIKSFETYEGLIANIVSYETKEELESDFLNCEFLLNNKKLNLTTKDYEYKKLNKSIKNNLMTVNDYVRFINEDKITYIILCGIKFNKDILNNISLNKKINTAVDELENNFINKYSKIYNLIIFK